MLQELLARTARALEGAGLPYMVIGGQAVLLYGEPRLTRDVDVTLGVSVDRLPDVLAVVAELSLRPLVDPESFTRETMVLPCQDPESGGRLDLVFSTSPYEREAIARARTVDTAGQPVRFAAPEDLVIHKMIAGRPRDLEDVRGILAKQTGMDRDWIRRWLEDFEAVVDDPLIERFDELAGEAR